MAESIRRLPDAELEVMQAVWACPPPVYRADLEAALRPSHPMATTTLLTLLSRLAEKGFLAIEKEGRRSRYTPKVKDVFIAGGGKVSLYLAAILEKMRMRVKIVEISEERCRHISETFPHTTVICGDGTDQELLESERMSAADAFVALTDRDEDNLIISLYAMQQGVQKVVAKSNRQNYAGIARAVGLDSVISPKLITAAQILQVVRGMQNSQGSVMNTFYRIADGSAEAMEFTVRDTTRHLKTPLKDLHLKNGILLAVIMRGREIIIPEGSSYIQEGDSVILISRGWRILDLNDIYEEEIPLPSAAALNGRG